ncbi:MAG: hypothetical protein AB8B71_07585 [Paracoccaceae bacterium]
MFIEVIHTPPGTTPDWIRKAWVGLQMPSVSDGPVEMPTVAAGAGAASKLGQLFSVLTGKAEKQHGYVVNAKEAVGLLSLVNEEAAKWWIEQAPHVLNDGQMIMFAAQCCREIDADEFAI